MNQLRFFPLSPSLSLSVPPSASSATFPAATGRTVKNRPFFQNMVASQNKTGTLRWFEYGPNWLFRAN